MTLDKRGFTYPLDTQLQRLRWRFNQQLTALANAQAGIGAVREQRDAVATEVVERARAMASAQAQRLDPVRTHHTLDHLAGLQHRHTLVERELQAAERLVVERRERLAATQAEIDKLERDRADALREHLRDAERRSQREVDQDWNARSAWRTRDESQREERS